MTDYEIVHTMTDYYDGPRGGVANFGGKPHVYESEWADGENPKCDTFLLSPISDDTLKLALEDWRIWLKWREAFDRGEVDSETHPALPEDRARHEELEAVLKKALEVDPDAAIRVTGEFKALEESSLQSGYMAVRWTVVE